MLRNIIIIKGKEIIYKKNFGETYPWEAISPLYMSLTYFIDELVDDVEIDFLNTVHYKIAYSTNSTIPDGPLLFIFVTDLGDPNDVIKEQMTYFNHEITEMLGGV
ncbi:MAG: hypothetical protein ACTSRP_18225 [Candidatus Helarchaeota archaeon]